MTAIQNHNCLRNAHYEPGHASNSGISGRNCLASRCSINSLFARTEKRKQQLVSVDLFVEQHSLFSFPYSPIFVQP